MKLTRENIKIGLKIKNETIQGYGIILDKYDHYKGIWIVRLFREDGSISGSINLHESEFRFWEII